MSLGSGHQAYKRKGNCFCKLVPWGCPPAEPGGKPRLELLGELSMMLRLAGSAQQKGPELNGLGVDLLSSVKGDAGTGCQRSQYVEVCI